MQRYKPYPNYKSTSCSWLEKVPGHWSVMRLKNVATCNDDALDEQTDPDYEIEYVDISSVSLSKGIEQSEKLLFEKAPSRARRKVKDGDVIVSTVRTYLKAIAPINHPADNMIVSTGFAVIRPMSNLHSGYAGYLLQSNGFVGDVVARSVGVSYPAINASDLVRIPAVEPPLAEQQTIARFLDHKTAQIDTLIAKKQALLEKLAEKRSALISHAVTKGLDPTVPMKDSGVAWLGEIPAHWGTTRIKFVAKVGNGSTPSRENADYWFDGHFPWLNSSVVNQESVFEADQFVTDLALKECHLPIVTPPAVLVGITGQGKTRGMASKLEITATINQHLVFVKPRDDGFNVDYLRFLFDMAYSFLRNESDGGGSTKGAITCEQIENLAVPFPPIADQAAIALHVQSEVDALIRMQAKIAAVIDRLQEYRSALITNAVTGKIDVRGFKLPEAADQPMQKEVA
ncbi:MAG: restriction endonuclease subunit [Proteobacteria bacterium]|nr:restriction endonuclease subunit [Pseudomonadota bacterium]